MGKRGPKSQPTFLKVMRGNPGKRPLNDREPAAPIGEPECPRWLDATARAEWRRLAPRLVERGTISPDDLTAFTSYCVAWGMLKESIDVLKKEGLKLGKRAHPMIAQRNRAMELVTKFGSLFGLNPSARSGIVATPKPRQEEDELEKMMRG